MPADEARIVQAARAWARALAALQEIADQSEAELAIHSAADRALAFKEAERALCQAIQQAASIEARRRSTASSKELASA